MVGMLVGCGLLIIAFGCGSWLTCHRVFCLLLYLCFVAVGGLLLIRLSFVLIVCCLLVASFCAFLQVVCLFCCHCELFWFDLVFYFVCAVDCYF